MKKDVFAPVVVDNEVSTENKTVLVLHVVVVVVPVIDSDMDGEGLNS